MLPDKPIQKIDVSRRQLLLSSGSFIAGASALAWAGSDRAAAATDIRDINIPNTSVETPDGGIESATCTTVGDYQYSVNDADTTRLELLVAPPDGEFQAIDTVESAVSTTSGSGQYTLTGSILDHKNITKALFAVEPEKIKTVTFPVRVRLAVLFDGEPVVEALAEGLPRWKSKAARSWPARPCWARARWLWRSKGPYPRRVRLGGASGGSARFGTSRHKSGTPRFGRIQPSILP